MNQKNILVSVIIPVYNRQDFINECVESITNQTYQNFEIIIVDDGSTDNTVKICQNLAKADERIKFYETEHGGVSAARNFALDMSNGDCVFFLDSDDIIHPHLLEKLVKGIVEKNSDISITDLLHIPNQSWHKLKDYIKNSNTNAEIIKSNNTDAIHAMFVGTLPLCCIGGVMMTKSLIGDTRFRTDLHISEDYYFVYQNLIKGAAVSFVKEKWYFVRNHATNSSLHFDFKDFWTRFYRRELVWESEEALGRTKHADLQKKDAFNCFLACARYNKPFDKETKKMRMILKKYRKIITPSLSAKGKLLYLICSYLPLTTHLILSKKH